jgi:hypothetical protein
MNWMAVKGSACAELKVSVCTCQRRLTKSLSIPGDGSRCPLRESKLTPTERQHYHFIRLPRERASSEPVESSPLPIPFKIILIFSNPCVLYVISYCEVSQLKLCMRFSYLYCGTGSADLEYL